MLNNCKDKGEKIRKNSLVVIFIKQHMGITGTDTGRYGQCSGIASSIKA